MPRPAAGFFRRTAAREKKLIIGDRRLDILAPATRKIKNETVLRQSRLGMILCVSVREVETNGRCRAVGSVQQSLLQAGLRQLLHAAVGNAGVAVLLMSGID